MVGWVAGEEERKKRARQEVSGRKLLLTFSISVWNILKAPCLFEIAQSLATMDRCLPHFFRSYLHTKDQLLSSYYAAKPQWAWERGEVTSKCKEPTEAPLIFQEFSGPGLSKASGRNSGQKSPHSLLPVNVGSKLKRGRVARLLS